MEDMKNVTYTFKATFQNNGTTDIIVNVSESDVLGGNWQLGDVWLIAARKANSYNSPLEKLVFVDKK